MMWVGHQREKLNIRLDGKEIKQIDGFVYLGGMVIYIWYSDAEVRRRTQAGANAWIKIEELVKFNIKKSKKQKGNVLKACITPACMVWQHIWH